MALGVMRAFVSKMPGRPIPTMTGETQKAFLEEWKKVLLKQPDLEIFAQFEPARIGPHRARYRGAHRCRAESSSR